MEPKYLGQMLIEASLIGPEQLREAMERQGVNGKLLGENLVELGFVSKQSLVDCLNAQIRELSNMVYKLIKNDFAEDPNELVDFEFYERHREELIALTRKSWANGKYATRIPVIDIQHVWLIMLSHYSSMIFLAMDHDRKLLEINTILDLLVSYTHEHFSVEEALLRRLGTDKAHFEQHEAFMKFITMKSETIKSKITEKPINPSGLINEICEFLNGWIRNHIATHDLDYAAKLLQTKDKGDLINRWIKELKEGRSLIISRRQKALFEEVSG